MYNNDFDFLQQLAHPENIEVLANEFCTPNCPHRKLHFDIYSAVQLGRLDFEKDNISPVCIYKQYPDLPTPNTDQTLITMDNFIKNYLPIGINRIKIVGRLEQVPTLADHYSHWLAKPEYQEEIETLLGGGRDFE